MDPRGTAPPAADPCLVSASASRKLNGGTLIDETVLDLAAHQERMRNPASYRPDRCVCGSSQLHIHDRCERTPRGTTMGVVTIMVFLCYRCSATWRVLPAFLARHLWRTWEVVEGVVQKTRRADEPAVPARTQRRWRARLAQAARIPMQVLVSSGNQALRKVAQTVGLETDRRALVTAYREVFGGSLLAPLAALLHRLSPGIRLL